MFFYYTLLGVILKIIFVIDQGKHPPDFLSMQSSGSGEPWSKAPQRWKEQKFWGLQTGPHCAAKCGLVQRLVQRAETEGGTAPGQTQEFNPWLSNPGSASPLCQIYPANGQKMVKRISAAESEKLTTSEL